MTDELNVLNVILSKVEAALVSYEKFRKNKPSYEESNDLTEVWRRLTQIKHTIQEHEGFDVLRSDHEIKDNESQNLFNREESHESFGTLAVTNVTGRTRLVGTTIDSLPNSVRLTFHRARRLIDGSTHSEYYMHKGLPLLQVEMSRNQWAEAICGINGIGVPVTIRTVMGTQMERVPSAVTSPFQQIINDAQKKANYKPEGADKFKEEVEQIVAHVDAMNLPKTKTQAIQAYVRNLYKNHISSVVSASAWAGERLAEEAEKSVTQAKVEVAASIQTMINQAGMKALGIENVAPQLRSLIDGSKTDE